MRCRNCGTEMPASEAPAHSCRRPDTDDAAALRDLVHTLWLYIGQHEERKLTSEQQALLTAVVERQGD